MKNLLLLALFFLFGCQPNTQSTPEEIRQKAIVNQLVEAAERNNSIMDSVTVDTLYILDYVTTKDSLDILSTFLEEDKELKIPELDKFNKDRLKLYTNRDDTLLTNYLIRLKYHNGLGWTRDELEVALTGNNLIDGNEEILYDSSEVANTIIAHYKKILEEKNTEVKTNRLSVYPVVPVGAITAKDSFDFWQNGINANIERYGDESGTRILKEFRDEYKDRTDTLCYGYFVEVRYTEILAKTINRHVFYLNDEMEIVVAK